MRHDPDGQFAPFLFVILVQRETNTTTASAGGGDIRYQANWNFLSFTNNFRKAGSNNPFQVSSELNNSAETSFIQH